MSRDAAPREPPRGWLFSQGLGILCGQAAVALLAVGSVALAATRDGASAEIRMDDLRGFFVAPSPVHLWFYLLVPVLGLYGLNVLLATWDSVLRKWRRGLRAPRAYAAAVVHLSFLVALFAHLVGGLGGAERPPVTVGPAWAELGDGRQARLASLELEPLPDGGLKQAWATVELRDPGGSVSESLVHYNGPLSSGLGADLLLLARQGSTPSAARLALGPQRCRVALDERCQLGGAQAELLYLLPAESHASQALARVRVQVSPGAAAEELWLMQGRPVRLAGGPSLSLEGIESEPAILLRRRHAPGNPWALLSAALLALGLGLMWRRFL